MKGLFVSYELAMALREKGFKEPCIAWWNKPPNQEESIYLVEYGELEDNNIVLDLSKSEAGNAKETEEFHQNDCSAPLYQQVVDWFRKEHRLLIFIHPVFGKGGKNGYDNFRHSGFEYQIIRPLNYFDSNCFYLGNINTDSLLIPYKFYKEDLSIGEEEREFFDDEYKAYDKAFKAALKFI